MLYMYICDTVVPVRTTPQLEHFEVLSMAQCVVFIYHKPVHHTAPCPLWYILVLVLRPIQKLSLHCQCQVRKSLKKK